MNRTLNDIELEYVWHHLALHLKGFHLIKPFIRTNGRPAGAPAIFMPLSDRPFSAQSLLWIEEGVPLLFPLSESPQVWSFTREGHLLFHHDILKSAFYLLSGRGEWEQSEKQDGYGRFRYDCSIQKQLNIIDKPVVNYYFSLIIDALSVFARRQGIELECCRPFGKAGVMITHDVDRTDYYSWRSLVFRTLQWMGLKPKEDERRVHLKMALDVFRKMMGPASKRVDPYWSFDFFRDAERANGLTSTWYFLNRDGSPNDAPYRLEEARIKTVVTRLRKEGCEVGLHGSFLASEKADRLKDAIAYFKKSFGFVPVGVRQHFLKGRLPHLYYKEQEAGLKYDAGLGFSDREGFRNSYCWPFHPFDHDSQAMLPLWVVPMTWMDTTLLEHRKVSLQELPQISDKLMDEVIKFNGLLNILWHSCRTNEWLQPGIHHLYHHLCHSWARPDVKSLTGQEVLELMEG